MLPDRVDDVATGPPLRVEELRADEEPPSADPGQPLGPLAGLLEPLADDGTELSGVGEEVWPRRTVDFWMDLAAAGGQNVELRIRVYTAARVEGILILLWVLAGLREDQAAGPTTARMGSSLDGPSSPAHQAPGRSGPSASTLTIGLQSTTYFEDNGSSLWAYSLFPNIMAQNQCIGPLF